MKIALDQGLDQAYKTGFFCRVSKLTLSGTR
jgi:hypothetical protein